MQIHWRDDRIRYSGLLGGAGINSEFFVLGLPVRYRLDGVFLYQDVKFRLGGSHFFPRHGAELY